MTVLDFSEHYRGSINRWRWETPFFKNDLKANDMFGKLQAAIADSEEQLQASRRIYNSNVSQINTLIVSFPTSIVAKKINIQKKSFFEAEESKRADVKMEF